MSKRAGDGFQPICLGQLVIDVEGLSHPHVLVMVFSDGIFSMALAHKYNGWVRIEPTTWSTFIYTDKMIFENGKWDVARIRCLARMVWA